MRILLVDDDQLSKKSLSKFIRSYLGHEVDEAESGDEAWKLYLDEPYPLVISDIRMPGMGGMQLLKKIKQHSVGSQSNVVMITGFGELKSAVEALRAGAFDYLQKPVDVDELAIVVQRSDEYQKLLNENKFLREEVKEQKISAEQIENRLQQFKNAYTEIFGLGKVGIFSPEMHKVAELAKSFHDDRDVTVLIQGETGTGKEVVARMIHFLEGEELNPFITINCSAISPNLFESELFGYAPGAFTGARSQGQQGKLELAQGGTLFLDEIGDMPLEMQPKLLRAIQMKEMYRTGGTKKIDLDIRFICATNRNLEEMMNKDLFRRDLFYRLNTGHIQIPPLKDRPDEILSLAQMFLLDFADRKNKRFRIIHSDAAQILKMHPWPGNIRELKNVIERVVLLFDAIELKADHLGFLPGTEEVLQQSRQDRIILDMPEEQYFYSQLEKNIIIQILKKFNGNKSKAAVYLGITRNRLNRKLQS
jgi:two-component system, NtrC family, response regulator AtoC